MNRIQSAGAALAFLAAASFAAPAATHALQIANGDVVAVFQKNGTEVIVNLGPVEIGATVDLEGVVDIQDFEGTLAGAKFVALAVPDPDRTGTCCGGTPVLLHNLLYSTLVSDPTPGDIQVEVAMGITDVELPGANTWFNLLRQLPGSASERLSVSEQFSYEAYLGVGSDRIANSFDFSIAAVFDGQGALSIPIYTSQRGYADFGGPAAIHEQSALLVIEETLVTFQSVPEASALAGTIAGGSALVVFGLSGRRRAARAE